MKQRKRSTGSQSVVDAVACVESVKQQLQERRQEQRLVFPATLASPAEAAHLQSLPCQQSELFGDVSKWQAIIFRNNRAIGRLLCPQLQRSGREADGDLSGLTIASYQLHFTTWQPAWLAKGAGKAEGTARSGDNNASKPLYLPVDESFRASEFRVQVIGKASTGASFALPFSYELEGSRLAVLVEQAAQRGAYVRAQRAKFAAGGGLAGRPTNGSESGEEEEEQEVEYGRGLQRFNGVFNVRDHPPWLKAVRLRFATLSVHDGGPDGEQPETVQQQCGTSEQRGAMVCISPASSPPDGIAGKKQMPQQPGGGAVTAAMALSAKCNGTAAVNTPQRHKACETAAPASPSKAKINGHTKEMHRPEGTTDFADAPRAIVHKASADVDNTALPEGRAVAPHRGCVVAAGVLECPAEPSTPDLVEPSPSASCNSSSAASDDMNIEQQSADAVMQPLQRSYRSAPPAAVASSCGVQQQRRWHGANATSVAQPAAPFDCRQVQGTAKRSGSLGTGAKEAAAEGCQLPMCTAPAPAVRTRVGAGLRSQPGVGGPVAAAPPGVVSGSARWPATNGKASSPAAQVPNSMRGTHSAGSSNNELLASWYQQQAAGAREGAPAGYAAARPPVAAAFELCSASACGSSTATYVPPRVSGLAATGGSAAAERVGAQGLSLPRGVACAPLHFPEDVTARPAPVFDLERLLLATTPLLATDKPRGAVTLGEMMDFYTLPSLHGQGVFTLGGSRGASTAYYVPYLAALRLFTPVSDADVAVGAAAALPAGSSPRTGAANGATAACISPLASPRVSPGCARPEFFGSPGLSPRAAAAAPGRGLLMAPRSCGWPEHMRLAYEFFEADSPYSRPALSDRLQQLAAAAAGSQAAGGGEGRGALSLDMPLGELHPYSWYAVAWYPVYRIPDAPLGGRFLTFHHLSPHALRLANAPPAGTKAATARLLCLPAVGLSWHNTRGGGVAAPEAWLQAFPAANQQRPDAAHGGSSGGDDGSVAACNLYRPSHEFWPLTLEQLKAYSSKLAHGEEVMPLLPGGPGLKSYVPDYEYFANRPDYNQ